MWITYSIHCGYYAKAHISHHVQFACSSECNGLPQQWGIKLALWSVWVHDYLTPANPEAIGLFEYQSDLTSGLNPNYDGVAQLLNNHDIERKRIQACPSTLTVCQGKNTAHHVTPIKGNKKRVVTVYPY